MAMSEITLKVWNLQFLFLVITWHSFTAVFSNELRSLVLQGMQPMTGTGWTGGAGCLPAALMAVRHINEKADLLDGYNLTYNWVDTQV